ncbi:MAG: YbaN family protein [Pseudomonadota bacterium]
MSPRRAAWFSIGMASLMAGFIGAALPLIPTTPFILLAAYAFAQSSERWHNWLINHKVFGPLIADWQEHGAISRRSKILAIISMVAVLGLSWYMDVALRFLVLQAIALSGSALFILTRPSPPESS